MPREKGDLPRNDPEPGPPPSPGRLRGFRRWGAEAGDHLLGSAPQIEVEDATRVVVKHQHAARLALVRQGLHRHGHLVQRAGGDAVRTVEGGAGCLCSTKHGCPPFPVLLLPGSK